MKLLKFSTSWCVPCKSYDPILNELENTYNVSIEHVDAEERYELTEKFEIQNVPTVIKLNDNGEEEKRLIGLQTMENLVREFDIV